MTYGQIYEYITANTNLPKQDIKRIAYECWLKGLTLDEALQAARELYVK